MCGNTLTGHVRQRLGQALRRAGGSTRLSRVLYVCQDTDAPARVEYICDTCSFRIHLSTSGLERETSPRGVCWFRDGSHSRRHCQVPNKSRPPPIRNQLLAALPGEEYERLLPQLESTPLPFMEILYTGGERIKHVYFPDDGLISLLIVMNDGTLREIGIIG